MDDRRLFHPSPYSTKLLVIPRPNSFTVGYNTGFQKALLVLTVRFTSLILTNSEPLISVVTM